MVVVAVAGGRRAPADGDDVRGGLAGALATEALVTGETVTDGDVGALAEGDGGSVAALSALASPCGSTPSSPCRPLAGSAEPGEPAELRAPAELGEPAAPWAPSSPVVSTVSTLVAPSAESDGEA